MGNLALDDIILGFSMNGTPYRRCTLGTITAWIGGPNGTHPSSSRPCNECGYPLSQHDCLGWVTITRSEAAELLKKVGGTQ